MTYDEICKYVFDKELISWDDCDSKSRFRPLVMARQISMFLGHWFYPALSWSTLALPFKKDHATAMYSIQNINNLMSTDKDFRVKVHSYIEFVGAKLQEQQIAEVERILKLKDADMVKTLISLVDKMELVARIYCSITGKSIN